MSPVPAVAGVTAVAAVPPALLARRVWQERDEPGARTFTASLVVIVVFDLLYAGSMLVASSTIHRSTFAVLSTFHVLISVLWLVFVLEYTGRIKFLTRNLLALLFAVPAIGFALSVTQPGFGLLVDEFDLGHRAGVYVNLVEFDSAGLAIMGIANAMVLVGIVMLLAFVVSDRHRYGHQTSVLVLVAVLPVVATLARVYGVSPLAPINLTPIAWAVGSLLVLAAMQRWDLFGFAPAVPRIGQAAAFDDLGEPVLIVDEEHRLVDANTHAVDLFGRATNALVQQPLESIFGVDVDLDGGDQTIQLETAQGHRDFDVTVSPIQGSWGGTIGHTIVLHDVTDEKRRRQRFEVLNRVLRHNLRNSMNAVVGYSRELGTHVNGSAEWMVERIEKQTMELVDLSEKARNIDRVTTPSGSPARFAVASGLDRVCERLMADHEELTVTVEAPAQLYVTAHEVVFEEVIQYAADSLIRYNDAAEPQIVLSATATEDERSWITCTITSNGDPIPEDERAVIEQGRETPLDHSHDLDLWLVSWGVDTLGGDLEFVLEADRPGLSLSIPDVRTRPANADGADAPAETD